jgi:hypothetical protein
MDYKLHYDNLIKTRKLLNRKRSDGFYYENHHVIMKSMGGDNNKENLVLLTAREHFIAHWLLWRIHRNKQTAFAFVCLKKLISKNQARNKITNSRIFEELREAKSLASKALTYRHSKESKMLMSKLASERLKGKNNPFYKKHHTEETKNNLSKLAIEQFKDPKNRKMCGHQGATHPRARKIYQYDINGNLIKEWSHIQECADICNLPRNAISKTANKNILIDEENSKIHEQINKTQYIKYKEYIFKFN